MSKRRRTQTHGPAAFDRYYGELFGERWPALRAALQGLAPRITIPGVQKPYYLDAASLLAAAALEVQPGDRVLDLCAAPGGKTLVLATALWGPASAGTGRDAGVLVANERSASRRARLHRVLDEHLPPAARTVVAVTGHDASKWALHQAAAYDRVLADVPCSSERHVLATGGELAHWSPSRPRRLAAGAYAILCAAVDAVVPGGRVVYSTCALSPAENDDVVGRILTGRRPIHVVAAEPVLDQVWAAVRPDGVTQTLPGVSTRYGLQIAPDTDAGIGPMYISILTRDME